MIHASASHGRRGTGAHEIIRSLALNCACAAAAIAGALFVPAVALATPTTEAFACSLAPATSVVPAGDNLARVTLDGAAGGGADGGAGEELVAIMPVTEGSSYEIHVGCQANGRHGVNDGAADGGQDEGSGGLGGGGATYIQLHGSSFSELDAIAGGGGGEGDTGYSGVPPNGAGGAGGSADSNGVDGEAVALPVEAYGGEGGSSGAAGGGGGRGGEDPMAPTASGQSGGSLDGGAGAPYTSYEGGGGGGGGGGWIGGGGGGLGGANAGFGAGGGGGGGGADHVAPGVTVASADDSAVTGDGSLEITYSVAPELSVAPSTKSFGSLAQGETAAELFTVTNTGEGLLNIGQASIAGPEADQFSIGQDSCSNRALSTSSCTVEVKFSPTVTQVDAAELSIPSNSSNGSPAEIAITGSGVAAPPTTPPIAGNEHPAPTLTAPAPPLVTAVPAAPAPVAATPPAAPPRILRVTAADHGCVAFGERATESVSLFLSQPGTIHYTLARRQEHQVYARCPLRFPRDARPVASRTVINGSGSGPVISARAASVPASAMSLVIPLLGRHYILRPGTYVLTIYETNAAGISQPARTFLRVLEQLH